MNVFRSVGRKLWGGVKAVYNVSKRAVAVYTIARKVTIMTAYIMIAGFSPYAVPVILIAG